MSQENEALFRQLRHFMHLSRRVIWQQAQQTEQPHHQGQARILQVIASEDNPTQSRLVEVLDVRPSSVSEMLSKLEAKGLIERHPDEKDGRITRVAITEAGKKHLSEAENSFADISDQIFGGLTEDEQKQLADLLAKLNTNLKTKITDNGPEMPPRFFGHGPRGNHPFGGPSFDKPRHGDPRFGGPRHGHHPHGPVMIFW